METVIFEIKFKDGRTFRVFCANTHQKNQVLMSTDALKKKGLVDSIISIVSGIHTVAEYKKIIADLFIELPPPPVNENEII